MDIKNTPPLEGARDRAAARTSAEAGGRGTATPTSTAGRAPADRVTLTDNARALLDLKPESPDAAPVDQGRVDALRLAIANGTFEVNAQRVADRLMDRESGI